MAKKKKRGAVAKAVKALLAEGKRKLAKGKGRAEALLALIARKKQTIAEDFYEIGLALREIYRRKLYRPLECDSFEELLAKREVMSRAQAFKLIRMVEHIGRDEALTMGQEKAAALIGYTAATPEPDTPEELVEEDPVIGDKHLSKMSVRDVEDAAKAVRRAKRRGRRKTAAEKANAAAEKAIVTLLRGALRGAGIARPAIEVTRSRVIVTIARPAAERAARS